MNPNDPNVQMLDVVAQRLGDELSSRLVFVGGAVAGLLITDPAQPSIRPTEDVDLPSWASSYGWRGLVGGTRVQQSGPRL